MERCYIIADDLTGANAAGALFARSGLRVAATWGGGSEAQVLIRVTESRNLGEPEARQRIRQAFAETDRENMLYCKRIDSTLRGNPGAEIDEMLSLLGDGWSAAVSPSFPGAGRVVRGGWLFVNGVPLSQTSGARDPVSPVKSSIVARLLRRQCARRFGTVARADYTQGEGRLRDKLDALYSEGIRVVLFDAETEEDLSVIAGALAESGRPYLAADPGPLSAAYYKALRAQREERGRILLAIGSICAETKGQLAHLSSCMPVGIVTVYVGRLLENEGIRRGEIARVADAVEEAARTHRICALVSDGLSERNGADASPLGAPGESGASWSGRIASGFGEIAAQCLGRAGFGGVFACGGDIAVQVIRALGADGMSILDEIQPLIAFGRLDGGGHSGLPMVTKGGMAGTRAAMEECVRYLNRCM